MNAQNILNFSIHFRVDEQNSVIRSNHVDERTKQNFIFQPRNQFLMINQPFFFWLLYKIKIAKYTEVIHNLFSITLLWKNLKIYQYNICWYGVMICIVEKKYAFWFFKFHPEIYRTYTIIGQIILWIGEFRRYHLNIPQYISIHLS